MEPPLDRENTGNEIENAEALEETGPAHTTSKMQIEEKSQRKFKDVLDRYAPSIQQGGDQSPLEGFNEAKEYYFNVISWCDGQKGVSKAQREQAKCHLKGGNEKMALESLQNIGDLEDEHDIDLLTDADKDEIELLSSSTDISLLDRETRFSHLSS